MMGTRIGNRLWVAMAASIALTSPPAIAQNARPIDAEKARVIDYWNHERRSKAVPRDLAIDPRGLGYLGRPDGSFEPHGHGIPAKATPGNHAILPFGMPPYIPPGTDPVTASGSKKGLPHIAKAAGAPFATNGETGGRNGSKATASGRTTSGSVQKAAGRIFFEMPADRKRTEWTAYVCSGAVATVAPKSHDGTERSVIITAAHCIYDDVSKVFARNVMFIPGQANAIDSGTRFSCNTDPTGCWVPSFGVVDENWAIRLFPDNVKWDYGFYVIPDSGAHEGADADGILDRATGSLPVSFRPVAPRDLSDTPAEDEITYALGYSNAGNFLAFCAESLTTEGDANWWLPSCELASGSSGGPWVRPTSAGSGSIVSVNSWRRTSVTGMAGPRLDRASAYCVFTRAKNQPAPIAPAEGKAGFAVSCR